MSSPFLYFENINLEIPEIPTDSIISRTLYSEPGLKVILFGFARGQELSEHTASMPAILHILQGEARLTLGTEEREAAPGTWVHMEAHLPHSVYARTAVVMLLLMLRPAVKSDEK